MSRFHLRLHLSLPSNCTRQKPKIFGFRFSECALRFRVPAPERWQSGLSYLTRNQACPKGYRGFESHPLRHFLGGTFFDNDGQPRTLWRARTASVLVSFGQLLLPQLHCGARRDTSAAQCNAERVPESVKIYAATKPVHGRDPDFRQVLPSSDTHSAFSAPSFVGCAND
jgi:hypothetical protein